MIDIPETFSLVASVANDFVGVEFSERTKRQIRRVEYVPRHPMLSLGPWTLYKQATGRNLRVRCLGNTFRYTNVEISLAEKLTLRSGNNRRLEKCVRCVSLLYN